MEAGRGVEHRLRLGRSERNRRRTAKVSANKTCSKCATEKPLESFAADRSKKDGRKAQCKECIAARARESYSSAERAKKHLAASPRARSLKTIRNRNSRWNNLAAEYGE